jgi:hypothetical protein
MRVALLLGALAVVLLVAVRAPLAQKQSLVILHKSCAVGTLGRARVEGACEFTAAPGFEIVADGVTFAWKAHRQPLGDCAGKVMFDPPAIEPHRIVVRARAEQSDGKDCGGVMVYHIATAAESGAAAEGSSARTGERKDPD